MGFDIALKLKARDGDDVESRFVDHLESVGSCDVGEGSAHYENDDTEVEFEVAWDEAIEEDYLDVRLTIPQPAPHVFLLEAQHELARLTQSFHLTVAAADGQRPYDPKDLLDSWRSSSNILGGLLGEQLFEVPTETVEAAWRWNLEREATQAQVGPDTFVPRIAFVKNGQRAASSVTWPDLMPALLPEVETLVIFATGTERALPGPQLSLVHWRDVARLLAAFPKGNTPGLHVRTTRLLGTGPAQELLANAKFIDEVEAVPLRSIASA